MYRGRPSRGRGQNVKVYVPINLKVKFLEDWFQRKDSIIRKGIFQKNEIQTLLSGTKGGCQQAEHFEISNTPAH